MNQVSNILSIVLLVGLWWFLLTKRKRAASLGSWLAAYRRGDYAAALEATEHFLRAGRLRDYWALRGGTLMQLGQLEEAEKSLNQAVALAPPSGPILHPISPGRTPTKSQKLSALAGAMLVELYLEQSQYNEAIKRCEASLRDWPGYGPFHAHMAEACLRRGDLPSQALKWATLAVEESRAGKGLAGESRNINLSETLTTLARAVAADSKNREQVDLLVGEAVKLAGAHSVVPTSAFVQFQSGLAYAALGDADRARQFWEEASRLDPQGRWGRAARAELTAA